MAQYQNVNINGIIYNQGDSFVCQLSVPGWSNSTGYPNHGQQAASLTKGNTYYFYSYNPGTIYCYSVSNSPNAEPRGWFPAEVFPSAAPPYNPPQESYTITYHKNDGSGITDTITTTNPDSQFRDYFEARNATYTISFDFQGGSSSTVPSSIKQAVEYRQVKWNTRQDGLGTSYYKGNNTFKHTGDLYAIWHPEGSIDLPKDLTKDEYVFSGWSPDKDSNKGMTGSYTPTEDITLYAIWTSVYHGINWKPVQMPWIFSYETKSWIRAAKAWINYNPDPNSTNGTGNNWIECTPYINATPSFFPKNTERLAQEDNNN